MEKWTMEYNISICDGPSKYRFRRGDTPENILLMWRKRDWEVLIKWEKLGGWKGRQTNALTIAKTKMDSWVGVFDTWEDSRRRIYVINVDLLEERRNTSEQTNERASKLRETNEVLETPGKSRCCKYWSWSLAVITNNYLKSIFQSCRNFLKNTEMKNCICVMPIVSQRSANLGPMLISFNFLTYFIDLLIKVNCRFCVKPTLSQCWANAYNILFFQFPINHNVISKKSFIKKDSRR